MCGISTIIRFDQQYINEAHVRAFNNIIAHRGPDGDGFEYFSAQREKLRSAMPGEQWDVAMAHRRLSIIDLSDCGKQPMSYREGNLWLVFNGEIYNYIELKIELEKLGCAFKSTSDTEVILAAYYVWDVKCFERLRGMWSIIILDGDKNRVVASRDRMGIKPLYYVHKPGKYLALASEIKQFTVLPGFHRTGELSVIRQYLLTGFEKTDRTFFKNVKPVLPGTYVEINIAQEKISSGHSFWAPENIQPEIRNIDDASALFKEEFEYSLSIHLRSDVPVGCQLSGGLDSSAVFSLMNKHYHGDAIHSFTVSFPGYEKDESPFVHKMLQGSRALPHFITPSAEEFSNEIQKFVWHHDEPVGSFAHYAGYSLARLIATERIKVVLNGQGGDEILGGYWQQYFSYLLRLLKSVQVKPFIAHMAGALNASGNEELVKQIPAIVRRYWSRRNDSLVEFTPVVKNAESLNYLREYLGYADHERRIFDIRNLILPRLLKWDDRNLMAFSIEGRYPFLDHRVIETALRFGNEVLFHKGWTKYPLRQAMSQSIPKEIYFRKSKWGFETPQQHWLGEALRPVLKQWLADRSKPLLNIVTPKSLESVASRFWKDNALEDAQLLFRLYLLDKWMSLYEIQLEG